MTSSISSRGNGFIEALTRHMSTDRVISIVAIVISIISAGITIWIWSDGRKYAEKLNRPHVAVRLSMFESRDENGIYIKNSGVDAALLKSISFSKFEDTEEFKVAKLDLESLGWNTSEIVKLSVSEGDALNGSDQLYLFKIDRSIGQTDIKKLDRLFNKLDINLCYCNAIENLCWYYSWKYSNRANFTRDEASVQSCS